MSKMDKLLGQINKAKKGSFEKDTRFYYPQRDNAKNGYAVLRFLPGIDDDAPYFVKTFNHGFKNAQGKWFIEECPTTIGNDCPCCEANGELVKPYGGWEQTPETVKEVVRPRKRKITYYANVLVIEDGMNPENEGKIFLFKFGETIFDMITNKAQPPAAFKETPIDVFDLETGCDFEFKIRQVKGQTNYESSTWRAPSARKVDLQGIEDLNQFIAAERFKTFDALKTNFDKVVGNKAPTAAQAAAESAPARSTPAQAAPARTAAKPAAAAAAGDSEDDILKMMEEITGTSKAESVDDDIPF